MSYLDPHRLKECSALANLPDVVLVHLADAACNAVENFLNRKLAATDYDELCPSSGDRSFFVSQYPVQSIRAVRCGMMPAMYVNNNTPNIQAATVSVASTSVTLRLTNNATETPNTLSYASYPTFGALTTAINNLGNGWYASTTSQFATWGTADLAVYAQTLSARQTTAMVQVHYDTLSAYQLDSRSGEIVTGRRPPFRGGRWAWRVQYRAGFDAVPEEIIQATIELAASTFRASKVDPNLSAENLGGYAYTRAADKSIKDLSIQSYATLRHYRKPRVPYFGVR